jgi:tRNA/tmRNA/rRNA uracil-C5-methylase (TrmA/RlmC/RlmD family)
MTDEPGVVELEVGAVAHGGICVARHEGQVVFVRHALPGERVLARVTDRRKGFLRADAVEILLPSADRVIPPCPFAGPGACGGCDWQHASWPAQRRLKSQVLVEQLTRLGGLSDFSDFSDLSELVEPLPGGPLSWRTRVQYAVDAAGRPGFHRHRSADVVPVDRCRIAHPAVQALPVLDRDWPPGAVIEAVASSSGDTAVVARSSRTGRPDSPPARVRERAAGREWVLDAGGFWQVHPHAVEAFTATVLDMLRFDAAAAPERAWDLYGGAGVFAAALAPHCGPVTVVESDARAVAAGRRALRDLGNVSFVRADVAQALANPRWRTVGVVVLDPPRAGAGRDVVAAIAARSPRAVAYVACDPAAFARDVRTFGELGYRLSALRAFDSFPMTRHFETIGLLTPR